MFAPSAAMQEGNQKIGDDGLAGLVYGQSVTDACVSFEATVPMLQELAEVCRVCPSLVQLRGGWQIYTYSYI